MFFPYRYDYLDAAKAYKMCINDKGYKESLYIRSVTRYAAFTGSYYYNEFKKLALAREKPDDYVKKLMNLRDSAVTYYQEAFKYDLDVNTYVAEQNIVNFINLHIIYNKIEHNHDVRKTDFDISFETLNNLETDPILAESFCRALIALMVNKYNVKSIFSGSSKLFSINPRNSHQMDFILQIKKLFLKQ